MASRLLMGRRMNSASRFCTILDWRGLTLATFAALAVAVDLSSSQAEIIPVDRRSDYMAALESASVDQDIKPFTIFLAGLLDQRQA